MWWSDCRDATVGKMSVSGTNIASVHATGNLFGIVAGPDGNMWFSECGSPNDIGYVMPAGPTLHTIPSSGTTYGESWAITEGPDGNVWYADCAHGQLLKVTPSGVITPVALPAGESAEGIVAGPDGNIWYANCGGTPKTIGAINPSTGSVVHDYTVPVRPYLITVGADGALWFTGGGNVLRITTAGSVTTYPTTYSSAAAITSGPDGNIWFTDCNNSPGYVGKMAF
jgi:virginiamycin B lyase